MTSKYRSWVCALTVVLAACAPQTVVPTASPSVPPVTPAPSPTAPPGLRAPIQGQVKIDRRWYTLPDGFDRPQIQVTATFDADPAAGLPYASIEGKAEVQLRRNGAIWTALLPLDGFDPGEHTLGVFERLADPVGGSFRVATATFLLTQPEYVVWTLDFEGDASGDPELTNTATIADELRIPMSVFWNPRVWTTEQVSAERQAAMLAWTKARQAKGDEVGLHLHMWTDYVRAAGVAPKTAPSWAGRGDGYDVPITAYTEAEQKTLIDYGVKLMTEHDLPKPTSFRAGGDMADASTLRSVAAAGFDADCTAVAKDYPPIGRIPYPWTLAAGAQPYRPSRTDANATGDLPLLEAPTIGGNTYGFTIQTIQPQIKANLALFAAAGAVATERKAITVVSHPGTIVPAELTAIESLLGAFGSLRYDLDRGPVRFVTLAQLARAYRP